MMVSRAARQGPSGPFFVGTLNVGTLERWNVGTLHVRTVERRGLPTLRYNVATISSRVREATLKEAIFMWGHEGSEEIDDDGAK